MNLIEELGGYEKAKQELERPSNTNVFYKNELIDDLLQYRRQHNIFEVGDRVVWINSITPNDQRLFEVEENLGEKSDSWSLRHATDEEIVAGHRL